MNLIKSIKNFAQFLQGEKKREENIDFVAFARQWCNAHMNLSGYKNYISAINALCRFFGKDQIMVSEITSKSMKQFEGSLSAYKRAPSLYTNVIIKLFNEAVDFYNDEERNIVVIKHSLSKYKAPKQNVAKKRGLPEETIKAIFDLPYDNIKWHGMSSRRDLAKDCFMLSFCLLGMNSADLFNATEFDGKVITYQRTKTKNRRYDKAEMQVVVPEVIEPLIKKYRGTSHVFNFSERFQTIENLNRAINLGLKDIGKEIGVPHLQFYSARHSMASIAVNKVGIDKNTVNDMLNHIDQSMRVTELYIEKDFTLINLANDELMHYMFDTEEQPDRQFGNTMWWYRQKNAYPFVSKLHQDALTAPYRL